MKRHLLSVKATVALSSICGLWYFPGSQFATGFLKFTPLGKCLYLFGLFTLALAYFLVQIFWNMKAMNPAQCNTSRMRSIESFHLNVWSDRFGFCLTDLDWKFSFSQKFTFGSERFRLLTNCCKSSGQKSSQSLFLYCISLRLQSRNKGLTVEDTASRWHRTSPPRLPCNVSCWWTHKIPSALVQPWQQSREYEKVCWEIS